MASTNVGVREMPQRPGTYATTLFQQQAGREEGYAFCHDTPGLGVEFDEEDAERFAWTSGGFTNW